MTRYVENEGNVHLAVRFWSADVSKMIVPELFFPASIFFQVMSPRKEVGKGLSELPIDDLVIDGKPEDEDDVPPIESPPVIVESEPPGLLADSEQPPILLESEQPTIPLESEQPVAPLESESPVVPLESEQSPDELVTETKAIAEENPPTPAVTPSPPVTAKVPDSEPAPEKVVKKKPFATILERKETDESGGNRIPKSGDLVQENEVC